MNIKHVEMKKIFTKFDEVKRLDSDYKPIIAKRLNTLVMDASDFSPTVSVKNKKKEQISSTPIQKQHSVNAKQQQFIYTQSEISKQVAKLKPYLALKDNIRTTQQLQQTRNKKISQQNYKMMSELAILENKRLCEIVGQQMEVEEELKTQRKQMEKQGWIFQIFCRISNQPRDDLMKKQFISSFAVMTEKVQIYDSLTFQNLLFTINPSSITMVKYQQDSDYEIITIEQGTSKIQCGFLDNKRFDLFDRMLFLQKNMSRSTSTRLFQNQLIKSIYAQYQKN